MAPAKLLELASTVFGPDRVRAADRLDDAIEIAVGLADEGVTDSEGGLGSTGVLITGSVITAGDARVLLAAGPGSPGGGAR
jgi:dihydrofolate synthase/folylpolyglutamate synthase